MSWLQSSIPCSISWSEFGYLFSEYESILVNVENFIGLNKKTLSIGKSARNLEIRDLFLWNGCCYWLGNSFGIIRWKLDTDQFWQFEPNIGWVISNFGFRIEKGNLNEALQFGNFGCHKVKSGANSSKGIPQRRIDATDRDLFLIDDNRLVLIDSRSKDWNGSPQLLQSELQEGASFVQISCGNAHTLLLDTNRTLHTFGNGTHGELGHGSLGNESLPTIVECFEGVLIEEISAGGWHSVVRTLDGDVYTWGWNESGQLGLNIQEHPTSLIPIPLILPDDSHVSNIACGSRHTVLRLESGVVHGCGNNEHAQIEMPHLDENLTAKDEIAGLKFLSQNSSQIVANHWSTVIAV